MGLESAIIGSSLIGGGFSLLAGDAQADAARAAGDVQMQQYYQTREDLEPWRLVGGAAIEQLAKLYGFGKLESDEPAAASGLPYQPRPRRERQPPGRELVPTNGMTATNALVPEAAPANVMAGMGRGPDTEVAHVTPGEIVVPARVAAQPEVRNALVGGFRNAGANPGRYVVGSRMNSLNPMTGRPEFRDPGYGGGPGSGDDGWSREGGARNPRDVSQDDERRWRQNPYPWMMQPQPPAPATPSEPELTPEQMQAQAIEDFYASPDYQIAFDEGQKMIEGSAAARGGLFSGNTGVALTKYGQDYGNRLYNQYANRLMGLAGFGQGSATATGQFGAGAAQGYGNALLYGGQAQANQFANFNNAIQSGLNNYLFYDYLRQ